MAITDIAELSKLVATTVAAYGDLTGARDPAVFKDLLTDPNGSTKFSDLEADEFIRTYEFVDQLPNDDVGFSATLFREKATGKLVFAVRGTEMDDDKINDLFIADIQEISGGYAKSQAVSMYRYFKKLSTPPGQAVDYSQEEIDKILMIHEGMVTTTPEVVRGYLLKEELKNDKGISIGQDSTTPIIAADTQLTVTGHSLGGHLALLFSRFFPDNTADVVTLNAPGFFPQSSWLSMHGIAPFDDSKITRVEGEGDGISEIGVYGFSPKKELLIAQETDPNPIATLAGNHSSVNGNQALALMALMAKLDSTLAHEAKTLSDIIRQGSNRFDASFEKTLDALRMVVMGPGQAPTETMAARATTACPAARATTVTWSTTIGTRWSKPLAAAPTW